jgi:hypothetical protein
MSMIDPKRKRRRSWRALDPDDEMPLVRVRHYGEANMLDFVRRLATAAVRPN